MKALVAGDRPLPADIAKLARDALVVGADGGGERLELFELNLIDAL